MSLVDALFTLTCEPEVCICEAATAICLSFIASASFIFVVVFQMEKIG